MLLFPPLAVTMRQGAVPLRLLLKRQAVSRKLGRLELVQLAQWRQARRGELLGGQPCPTRTAPQSPPRPQTPPGPLSQPWSGLPAPRRQEVLVVLSQIIAKNLPPVVRKEAGHEHP